MDIFRNLYNSLEQMGSAPSTRKGLTSPQRNSRENRILTVLQNFSERNIGTSQNQLPIFKKGDFEVTAQLDQNNQINGYAVLRRNFAIVFEGEFTRSKKNGYGIQYEDGKVSFEGNFYNDLRDGWGKDQSYQGQYVMGKRNGWGIETGKASRYEGYWKQGKQQGMGVKFYGRVPPTHCFDYALKEAIFTNFNIEVPCQIYLGEWKEGKRSGVGKLRGIDFIYEGQFQQGVYHGKGDLRHKIGAKQVGNFVNGEFIPQ